MRQSLVELIERPSRLWVLLLCVGIAAAHQAVRWDWFIDDSGICFAYARNLATGEGAVPWPGGERIEAVSDPTWVLLLTVLYWVGLDGMVVAKPLAMVLGAITLFLTWRIARLALPDHDGAGALVAPVLVALSAQFAIWSASGLENSLFSTLLAAAILRSIADARDGTVPWGSLWWLAIAWTRPEGLLYAAVGGFWFLVWTVRDGRSLRRVAAWLAMFWLPTLGLIALRLWYFAWPLPNTYYAKIGSRGTSPINWTGRGWSQLRDWAARLWHGYWVPLYVAGLVGLRGQRAVIGGGVVALLAISLLWPGPDKLQALWVWPALAPPPRGFAVGRIVALVAAGGALPLLAIGRPGGRVLALCGHLMWVGLGFSIVANGDWMGAYRWMSLVVVPGAVLLTAGLVRVLDAIAWRASNTRRWGPAAWLVASLFLGLQLPPNLSQTRDHRDHNKNETIASVVERVKHTRAFARRAFWEEPIVNLEVDQGAHLWFVPEYRAVDMAMLVDTTMSHHWFQQDTFVQEYIFDERKPTFAHVGGWWAKHTGLRAYADWKPVYFELPPYTDPRWDGPFHNVFARRELVLTPRWDGTEGRRRRMGPAVLEGFEQPAVWTPGQDGYLEAPVSLVKQRGPDAPKLQLHLHLVRDDRIDRFELTLGYGVLPPATWPAGAVFRGRHAVALPADLPTGTYDARFVLTRNGERLAATTFADALTVVGADAHAAAIAAARDQVAAHGAAGGCEAAEAAWVVLKRHRPRAWAWHDAEAVAADRAIAECWALRALAMPDEATALLARAHRWDHWSPALRRVGRPVGDKLWREGMAAYTAGDHENAYALFTDLLAFQPWRSWARRRAEESRDHRLGLVDDVRVGIGGADDLKRHQQQRREQR